MSAFFDIYSIIFLVIAVVIFMRLGSVLGRRTGNEPTPYDRGIHKPARQGNDNIVALPKRDSSGAGPAAASANAEAIVRHADAGSDLHSGLTAVAAADGTFDPDHFLEGAKRAYGAIVEAFNDGDRTVLKNLLEPEVYDGFVSAIEEREGRGERVESTFVGIESAKISQAGLDGRIARVTVRFVSELISVTKNKEGAVVDGDPAAVQHIRDAWTFARDVRSRDPNWKLVATEAV